MRKLTIKVQQGTEVMAMRVVALATYGDIAVHHPDDDYDPDLDFGNNFDPYDDDEE